MTLSTVVSKCVGGLVGAILEGLYAYHHRVTGIVMTFSISILLQILEDVPLRLSMHVVYAWWCPASC